MNKVIATATNNQIQITGYINGATISINRDLKVECAHPVQINEFEINGLYARIKEQLNVTNDSCSDYAATVSALKNSVEIDFSTQLDIADIEHDLRLEDETKINVTGDSEAHINKLISQIRANVEGVDEILVDHEKSKKGRTSTYIRIYK